MQYSPNKWQVKIKRNKDYMYITQHSFSTESSAQLLTEIHELKKKLSTTVKKKKNSFQDQFLLLGFKYTILSLT